MSVSVEPFSILVFERLNWSAFFPPIPMNVAEVMFFADTWIVATVTVLPSTPAVRSIVSGEKVIDGSPCGACSVMSSMPRGPMMRDVALTDVSRPVSVMSAEGMSLPMSDVPLKIRTFASFVPSVTVGCAMPSANLVPSATSLNLRFFTITTFWM